MGVVRGTFDFVHDIGIDAHGYFGPIEQVLIDEASLAVIQIGRLRFPFGSLEFQSDLNHAESALAGIKRYSPLGDRFDVQAFFRAEGGSWTHYNPCDFEHCAGATEAEVGQALLEVGIGSVVSIVAEKAVLKGFVSGLEWRLGGEAAVAGLVSRQSLFKAFATSLRAVANCQRGSVYLEGMLARGAPRISIVTDAKVLENFLEESAKAASKRRQAARAREGSTIVTRVGVRTGIQKWQDYESYVAALHNRPAMRMRFVSGFTGRRVTFAESDHLMELARPVPVEAKFVRDWATSYYNPKRITRQTDPQKLGAEAGKVEGAIEHMMSQAHSYRSWDSVVYYSNSREFIAYWAKAFQEAGFDNIRWVFAPSQLPK